MSIHGVNARQLQIISILKEAKRAVKKAVNPLYGKKGVGLAKNPKRAVKNAVYKKTTVGVKDLLK